MILIFVAYCFINFIRQKFFKWPVSIFINIYATLNGYAKSEKPICIWIKCAVE